MRVTGFLAAMALLTVPFVCRADIAIHLTRLIHEGDQPLVAQRIWNKGGKPSLIQAWVDDGDDTGGAMDARPPFFATPPMFSLEAGRNRDISIRLVDAAALPGDRESLYWLNVLDLPANAKGEQQADFTYAVRWRVKLFHRPAGLPGVASEAPAQLKWRLQRGAPGSVTITARNDGPYHVSLRELQLGGAEVDMAAEQAVVKPYSEWSITTPEPTPGAGIQLKGVWLDDAAEGHDFEVRPACDGAWCLSP